MKITAVISLLIAIPSLACHDLRPENSGFLPDRGGQTYFSARTISVRFPPPADYKRRMYEKTSFQYYLSNFPLKPPGTSVYYYNGLPRPNQEIQAAVLDLDIGHKDLQQCADAVIRLRAEYLYARKRFGEIHFNFTNGFRADYSSWAEGYRIRIDGNKVSWVKSKKKDYSHDSFKTYLEIVFAYAGTLSLSKELVSKTLDKLETGDVFIHGGSPGHAVIVMDAALSIKDGHPIFILAQSYMPAQSIHILRNPNDRDLSPWYDLSSSEKLVTPEWTFEKSELKCFQR